jgi:LPS-assembly protein
MGQLIVRQNRVDQRKLPDEDARSLVYDDTLLFDIDKFSGYDRYETGTRANVGMQYTFQANNGVYGRAVFGQSFQLAGENAYADPGQQVGLGGTTNFNFSPANGLGTNRSDYVAGVYITPVAGLNLISQSRFDEKDWSLRRQDSVLQGGYGPISAMAAYTFTHFDPLTGAVVDQKEINASLTLKLTNTWSVSGLMRYDLQLNERIQDQYQIKYADECFVLSASYIETFVANPTLGIVPDKTFMLRFELKNIGEFNYKTDALSHVFGDSNQGPKL